MRRSDFLKILGFAVAAPTILVPSGNAIAERVWKSKYKRWPIYPDFNYTVVAKGNSLEATLFSYVKIKRNGSDYLIAVRETYAAYKGDTVRTKTLKDRFDYMVKNVEENYQIDENAQFVNGVPLFTKYNPNIHHD